ncbi:hypothetical protein QYF36_014251 [Acer negundo]|nr:hypothetical protein QYF36_014251 [Acer negundo]
MVDDEIAKLCANMSLLEKAGPVRLLQEGLMEAGAQRLALSLVEARELPFGAWLKASAPVKTWNRRCGVISGNHNPMQRRNQGGLDDGQPNWQPAAVVSIDQAINGKSSDGVFFRSDDNGDNDRSFVCSKERNNFRRGDPSNGFVFQTSHNILKGTRPGKIEMRERPKSNYKGKEKVDK